jgi:hypothetical protein
MRARCISFGNLVATAFPTAVSVSAMAAAAALSALAGGASPAAAATMGATVNARPVLAQPEDMTLSAGEVRSQSLSASDADDDALVFYLAAGPSFAVVRTTDYEEGSGAGEITLSPGFADIGTASATVGVSDGSLVDTRTFGIAVLAPAPCGQPVFDTDASPLAIGGASDQRLTQIVSGCGAGSIVEVDLPVTCDDGHLIVEIQGVANGLPNGVVLASRTLPASDLQRSGPAAAAMRPIVFPAPIAAPVSKPFAIVLRSDGDAAIYQGPVGDSYPGGYGFVKSLPLGQWRSLGERADLPFRVAIVPPGLQDSPPVARAGGPYSGFVGEAIDFNAATSSDPDGTAITYWWSFGDGATATDAVPRHAYGSAGTFAVNLTVTDGGLLSLGDLASTKVTIVPVLTASVKLGPEVINLGSRERWMTAYIEIPLDPGRIDVSTLRLAGSVPAVADMAVVGDHDGNGVPDLAVKFSEDDLGLMLTLGANQLEVTGSLVSGTPIRGSGDVRVINSGGTPLSARVSPNPLRSAGVLTYTTARPGRVLAEMYDVEGRLVRTLVRASLVAAGTHEVAIGRSGDRGEPLAHGVYFYRIVTPDGTITGRVAMVE